MLLALASMTMGLENPVHLIFLAAVALIVLGPKRLPELAKALGHGIREFRDAISQEQDVAVHDAPVGPQYPPAAHPEEPPVTHAPLAHPEEPPVMQAPDARAYETVDPAQPLRSDDAPDRRPL